jgi:2,4-dienoyl-CoA reductase-like NADH-dependent reductase (Old Yellow Enzyme family)
VEEGAADYISMSRPFIWEPDLIARWKAGGRRKAECKSDNLCFKPGLEGNGIYCVTKQRVDGAALSPLPAGSRGLKSLLG